MGDEPHLRSLMKALNEEEHILYDSGQHFYLCLLKLIRLAIVIETSDPSVCFCSAENDETGGKLWKKKGI